MQFLGCRRYPFLYDKGGLMYLLIDNYDSFTYNLADLVAETGRDVQVCRCDQIGRNEIAALKPQGLIISPGPKRPEDAVHSLSIVRAFCRTCLSWASVWACRSWPMPSGLPSPVGSALCTGKSRRFTIMAGADSHRCLDGPLSRRLHYGCTEAAGYGNHR